ncbi:hypothetical protein GGR51DRAFT_514789 [Nemania sp. FL0031]|nr:hypothetical protein GGR51DRAFT_514789 [Nemania sp. FL0031]
MANAPTGIPTNIPLKRPRRPLVHPKSNRRIRIHHPGYSQCRGQDLLFQFAALDHVDEPSRQERIWGAHYGTIITACGIITNNAFDQVYLSKDVYGKEHATTHRGILEHGDYWLQLRGSELPDPQDSTSTYQGDKFHQYPIVPSFWNWSFPHGKLPAEWQRPHNPPTQLQRKDNEEEEQGEEEVDRCYLENLGIGIENAYLVPTAYDIWMTENQMDRYCDEPTGSTVHSKRNIISLMANVHRVFESGAFVIVPKPWAGSPNSSPPLSVSTTNSQSNANGQSSVNNQPINPTPTANPTSTTNPALTVEPQLYAFAVHVLSFHPDAKDFGKLCHNQTIHPKYIGKIARECLFARFAWAIFPFLYTFLNASTVPRQLSILDGNETKNITVKPGQLKGIEDARKASTSASNSNSRKRGRDSTENVELDNEDNSYARRRRVSDSEYKDRDHSKTEYWDMSSDSDDVPGRASQTRSVTIEGSYRNKA